MFAIQTGCHFIRVSKLRTCCCFTWLCCFFRVSMCTQTTLTNGTGCSIIGRCVLYLILCSIAFLSGTSMPVMSIIRHPIVKIKAMTVCRDNFGFHSTAQGASLLKFSGFCTRRLLFYCSISRITMVVLIYRCIRIHVAIATRTGVRGISLGVTCRCCYDGCFCMSTQHPSAMRGIIVVGAGSSGYIVSVGVFQLRSNQLACACRSFTRLIFYRSA